MPHLNRDGDVAGRPLSSVERALAVLDALAASGGPIGTNELARRVGASASSVSRLLGTLAAAGYVAREPEGAGWQLGFRVVELANALLARLDLGALARPLLDELVARSQETATLSIPAGGVAVTAAFVPSPRSVISQARIGRPSVPHATAVGKILLAYAADRDALLAGGLDSYTGRTIVDRDALERESSRVRAQGFAEAAGEREPDLNAIAAGAFDHSGRLAAILGIQGPARFDAAARRDALPVLQDAAQRLTLALGGSSRADR